MRMRITLSFVYRVLGFNYFTFFFTDLKFAFGDQIN